jgi:cysteine desulfurase
MTADAPLYLDANASVPPLPEAKRALAQAVEHVANPSSPHALGRAARRRLDDARRDVAAALGGGPKDVVFTSGASEANRWLVDALRARARLEGRALRVVTSPLEHPSLRRPLEAAAADGSVELSLLSAREDGALIDDDDAVPMADALFVTAAHNETGILPRADALFAAARDDAIVSRDAAQAVGRLPIVSARVDAIVASAHKMGGVSGAGALLLRGRARALPLPWAGPGQEGGRRPGTEALALQAAHGAAAAVVERTRAENASLAKLRDSLEAALVDAWGARVVGKEADRLPNTTALLVDGVDPEALRLSIDRAGVCVGFGSACSALAPEPSAALIALGLSREQARATVRLSLAPGADAALVDGAVARLRGALPR